MFACLFNVMGQDLEGFIAYLWLMKTDENLLAHKPSQSNSSSTSQLLHLSIPRPPLHVCEGENECLTDYLD